MINRITSGLNRLARGIACAGIALAVAMTVASSAQAQSAVAPPGAGTEANPYQISQLGHLVWIGDQAGSSEGQYYTLQNDLDASATAGWNSGAGFAPIGSSDTPFMGAFDGNGKAIGSLVINRPGQDDVGLFGYMGSSGMVKNLDLTGGAVVGKMTVGGLVGMNEGTVSECHATGTVTGYNQMTGGLVGWNGGTVSGCYMTGTVTGPNSVGGLVGWNYTHGTVSGCHATGAVVGDVAVGGLVGGNDSQGTVSECYATGPVTGTGDGYDVGGLVGQNNYGTVSGCHATGAVAGNWQVGGLVGCNGGGTVAKCYATGTVAGSNDVGGLVGFSYGPMSNCYATGTVTGTNNIGGLVGWNGGGSTVLKCYATGLVTGNTCAGGLVGTNIASNMVGYSYWDTQTSGQAASDGGTGKTTAQMKQQATFVGWDFANAWSITENVTYPLLRILGVVGPLITANGLVGAVYLNSGDPVTIAVQMMNIEPYLGAEVDWWVVANARSGAWYYMDSALQWQTFNGNVAFCQPAAQGPLANLSPFTVLDRYQLLRGTYDFWFAIDSPKDGILNLNGQIMFNKVTVVVRDYAGSQEPEFRSQNSE